MGNKLRKVVKVEEKIEHIPKVDPFKGRIYEKTFKVKEEEEIMIPTSKEDYELRNKKSFETMEDLKKLQEQISKEVDESNKKEEEIQQNNIQEQILSGKREFGKVKGMTNTDFEFINPKDEKRLSFQEQIFQFTDQFQSEKLIVVGEQGNQSPKKREIRLQPGESINGTAEKLKGTFRSQDLILFFENMRKIKKQDIEEREEKIQEFMKENEIDRRIVDQLLKYYQVPLVFPFKSTKIGIWNK